MSGFKLICCVVNMGEASKVVKVARKYGIKGATISIGHGVVHSRLMSFFALNEVRKEIISMVAEDEIVSAALQGICQAMQFDKPHHGIVFTYAVQEFIGSKNMVRSSPKKEGGKKMYSVIFVIVEKGRGEEVIEAANLVCSTGATIINARGAGVHEVQKFFSVEIEPEKEEVFIISRKKNKDKIINSIREKMKIDEPGNGILYVLDVNEAFGLHGL